MTRTIPGMTASAPESALIVGAGPVGLACALSARQQGVDPLIVEAGPLVGSIVSYPIGMTFFTTPERLEIGNHPFPCAASKPTREEAMRYYRGIVRTEGLRVRTYTRLRAARRDGGTLVAELETQGGESLEIPCRRLVLATGYLDHPRLLGVPGEDLPHVKHTYDEGHLSAGQPVVVVGGKNSAVEAALDLFRSDALVTLVHRRDRVGPTVKYWIRPDFENRVKAGEITARFESRVTRIEPGYLFVESGEGGEERLPADRVYLLTGYQPDFELFRRCGVELHADTMVPTLNADTLESSVTGIHLVGSITHGRDVSEVFIENGRFDGEKVFADLPRLAL